MSAFNWIRIAFVAGVGVLAARDAARAHENDIPWDYAKSYGAVSVRERSRKDFEPDGVQIGNFLIFSEVGVATSWWDDSLATDPRKRGDFRHLLFTDIEMRSQLPRHFVGVKLFGRAVQYQEQSDLRYVDGGIESTWRVDINREMNLFGGFSSQQIHNEDVDAERPKGTSKPPQFVRSTGEIGFNRTGAHIDAAVGLRYLRFDYSDIEANDGSRIDLGWQDYSELRPFIRLGWRLSPGYRVFAEVEGRLVDNRGTPEVDRDSRGGQANVGVEFELSPLVRAMVKGGWVQQDYANAGFTDVSAPVWEGKLEWLVTPLVTLSMATRRDVYSSTFGTSSARLITSHTLRADYELWRNLIVTAHGTLRDIDYVGTSRNDTAWIAGIGADYMYTKNWFLGVAFEHQELKSNEAEFNHRLNKISVSVKYRF